MHPQKLHKLWCLHHNSDMYIKCMHTQGKEPLTELFCLEDVSYNLNVI